LPPPPPAQGPARTLTYFLPPYIVRFPESSRNFPSSIFLSEEDPVTLSQWTCCLNNRKYNWQNKIKMVKGSEPQDMWIWWGSNLSDHFVCCCCTYYI
jgi:hypothetical protein